MGASYEARIAAGRVIALLTAHPDLRRAWDSLTDDVRRHIQHDMGHCLNLIIDEFGGGGHGEED